MMIAQTSLADGIAIVAFATVLFLVLYGFVSVVKWIGRLISRRPNPAKFETVWIVLSDGQEELGQDDRSEDIRKFVFYLNSRLVKEEAGHLTEIFHEGPELFLCSTGNDATQIWEVLGVEVAKYSPCKPERVVLKRARTNGGTQTLHEIPWEPGAKLDFQIPTEAQIPENWLRFSKIGRGLSTLGILGLFGWNSFSFVLGQNESEFMDTPIGMVSAYLVGITLILGLLLSLICGIRIRAITKDAGFHCDETPTSKTLKYVLLIVISIFALILLLL